MQTWVRTLIAIVLALTSLSAMSERVREQLRALRKTNLARLLARRPEGIFVSAFERGEMPGPVPPGLFGLESLVSKAARSPVPRRSLA
jgi:hypothetical protein